MMFLHTVGDDGNIARQLAIFSQNQRLRNMVCLFDCFYVDSVNDGCTVHFVSVCIVAYADDIILLAPSVGALQRLVSLCEVNLHSPELTVNI